MMSAFGEVFRSKASAPEMTTVEKVQYARLAHLVERTLDVGEVTGSIPVSCTIQLQ